FSNNFNLRHESAPYNDERRWYLKVFMERYCFPAYFGLKAANPALKLVGPELADRCGVPKGGDWYNDWLNPLQAYYPFAFDVLSLHRYEREHGRTKAAMEKAIALTPSDKRIWLTEVGYDFHKLGGQQQSNQLFQTYADAASHAPIWQVTFYHDLS